MFNQNSGVVIIWVKNIREGRRTFEEVPALSNLREVVKAVLGV